MTDELSANWVAYFAILGWPLVALIFYQMRPFAEATAWTVLGALLFLPSHVAIKFPMIPAIDKNSVASASILIGAILFAPRPPRVAKGGVLVAVLAIIYVVSPMITSVLNGDVILAGDRVIPAVGYYDGVSAMLSQAILLGPFFVGRRFVVQEADVRAVLRVLVIAGAIYSLPMLFEIRMSPQLSQSIYGTFSSSFPVEMRYGGFRPVVFMINGLAAAFFLSTAVLAALAFWRTGSKIAGYSASGFSAYLSIVLVLCKSAGALMYAVALGAVVRFFSPALQKKVAVFLACLSLAYPLLRMNDLFPTNKILELVSSVNDDRAGSLRVRFDQEQELLAHASERFWFGWGRYGRNRMYDENGSDISITDGQWIVTFGQFGFLGFIAQFGLLAFPVFVALRASRAIRAERDAVFLCCLSLVVAISIVEQLPNASIAAWNWLLAGALLGRSINAQALSANRSHPKSIGGVLPPREMAGRSLVHDA